jgi:hypothetical protein
MGVRFAVAYNVGRYLLSAEFEELMRNIAEQRRRLEELLERSRQQIRRCEEFLAADSLRPAPSFHASPNK